MGENTTEWINKQSLIKWQRAGTVYPNNTLYGVNGVDQADIIQGSLGNCWFLAACHTLSKIPSRVENVFLNLENKLSPNGIYGVNFYLLGVPHTVIIDDYLPLVSGTTAGSYKTYFASISPDSALWVPILEKAFAKLYGNYAHIVGGDPR